MHLKTRTQPGSACRSSCGLTLQHQMSELGLLHQSVSLQHESDDSWNRGITRGVAVHCQERISEQRLVRVRVRVRVCM
jgi:hypothetical protein